MVRGFGADPDTIGAHGVLARARANCAGLRSYRAYAPASGSLSFSAAGPASLIWPLVRSPAADTWSPIIMNPAVEQLGESFSAIGSETRRQVGQQRTVAMGDALIFTRSSVRKWPRPSNALARATTLKLGPFPKTELEEP